MQPITVESYVHVLIFLLVCLKNLYLLEIYCYITNKGFKGLWVVLLDDGIAIGNWVQLYIRIAESFI